MCGQVQPCGQVRLQVQGRFDDVQVQLRVQEQVHVRVQLRVQERLDGQRQELVQPCGQEQVLVRLCVREQVQARELFGERQQVQVRLSLQVRGQVMRFGLVRGQRHEQEQVRLYERVLRLYEWVQGQLQVEEQTERTELCFLQGQ